MWYTRTVIIPPISLHTHTHTYTNYMIKRNSPHTHTHTLKYNTYSFLNILYLFTINGKLRRLTKWIQNLRVMFAQSILSQIHIHTYFHKLYDNTQSLTNFSHHHQRVLKIFIHITHSKKICSLLPVVFNYLYMDCHQN